MNNCKLKKVKIFYKKKDFENFFLYFLVYIVVFILVLIFICM